MDINKFKELSMEYTIQHNVIVHNCMVFETEKYLSSDTHTFKINGESVSEDEFFKRLSLIYD